VKRNTSIQNSVPTVNESKKSPQTWFAGTVLIVLLAALLVVNGRVTTASHKEIPRPFSQAYDATGAMLDAVVFPAYSDQRIQSPLAQYDATGAMLDFVVFPTHSDQQVSLQGLAYDALGTMLHAVVYSHQVRTDSYPLWYDATEAMLEAVVFPKYPD
jgi:hypothetical protein